MPPQLSQKALVAHSHSSRALDTIPIPSASPGSAVVRILSTPVVPYMSEVLSGKRLYPLSFPLVPGTSAIARVHSVGPDAVSLEAGQLVFCESTLRARDEPNASILMGLHSGRYPGAQKLMEGEWRNATYAEYAKFPLENLYPLNEHLLLEERSYTVQDLGFIPAALVPYGGLSQIGLKSGDTIIVAPATGKFGGAAVITALAMGANVIAAGRSTSALAKFNEQFSSTGRLRTVQLTGDEAAETSALRAACQNPTKGADAYIDFSPPEATRATHIAAAISALAPQGRCCLMGGIQGHISLPYRAISGNSIEIHGRFMYNRREVQQFIKMVEGGVLELGKKIGVEVKGRFGLDHFEDALVAAAEQKRWDGIVVIEP